MEPLTSEEVARAAGFSPNYLSRRFRSVTGIGLHEYLVFVRLQHAALDEMTATHQLEDRFSVLSEQEFRERPENVAVPLCYGVLSYTWEQYSAHVEATLNTRRPNYRAVAIAPTFRNIDAFIVKGSHAVICKHNEPGIQFIIRHPKLVSALENYVVVLDQD
jgi:hypothetical protein